jgi:short-subunit dehydrogenase
MRNTGTAVVTGGSSGIGAAFARRLASEGYDVILAARRKERLDDLASELEKNHGVTAESLVADLSEPEGVARVEERIRSLDNLEILVNNAGFGAGGRYFEVDLRKQLDMIHVHIIAVARLCRAALPSMVERHSGSIINVSSIAAFMKQPRSAMYCSTKAWEYVFSTSLAGGLIREGIRMQVLCPGFTRTEFHDAPEYRNFKRSEVPKFLWTSAEKVVDCSMKALAKNKAVCIPGLSNRILAGILRSPLGPLVMRITTRKQENVFP